MKTGATKVKKGDIGEDVRTLQERLVSWGALLLSDGIFGSTTELWVRRFQDWKSLTVDGIAGPMTVTALADGPDGVIPDLTRRYRMGDRGAGVVNLQERLVAWGAPITVDGTFGPSTEIWLTWFQYWRGLIADGVAGRETISALAYYPDGTIPDVNLAYRRGDSGMGVRLAQQRLILWGASITADGVFGADTETWVTRFQDWRDLPVDGMIGPVTKAALDDNPRGVIPDLNTTYRPGDRGGGVGDLQSRLVEWGATIAIDGDYGPATETWVRRFQDWKDLTADGIADRWTIDALAYFPDALIPDPDTEYRKGDRGDGVSQLQERLVAWGAPVTVDGVFGSGTETWVIRFQNWKGLDIDGVVGPETERALVAEPDGIIPNPDATYRIGDRGEGVRAVQNRLIAWGATITADGVFGSGTESWVIRFQWWKGVLADGAVGPDTHRALAFFPDGRIPGTGQEISIGDRGEAVRAVQMRLVAWGAPITADGIFGSTTETWVRQFQDWKGLFVDGIIGPYTLAALAGVPDGRIPEPDVVGPPSANPIRNFTARSAAEIVSHEGFVREAYRDSVGVWTWSVGITAYSGHPVLQYKDNPQPSERCFEVFKTILENTYIPQVLDAFDGYQLAENELAAAVSFHYNTGGIARATWVQQIKEGDRAAARRSIMNWRSPASIIARREKERDLFFDGVWSSNGTALEFPVNKPSYSPDFARGIRVNVLPVLEELFPDYTDGGGDYEPAYRDPFYVSANALNIRSSPDDATGAVIGRLRMGAKVGFLDQAGSGNWVRVECEADNWLTSGPDQRTGYVWGDYLRPPSSPVIERLVAAARREWVRFDYGNGYEAAAPYYDYVGEMWRAIGLGYDGRVTSIPWSAAAISFVVANAAPGYEGFEYSQGHWKYINDAIADRELGRDGPFLGYRITERRPAVGDLVAKWRGTRITYGEAYRRSRQSSPADQSYTSHTDIVVAVTDNQAHTLGGNVGNSFSLSSYPLTSTGYLQDYGNVFAVLKNNAG